MSCENRQHLVPRSIGKVLGMSKREINKYVVPIDPKIHPREDKYVPAILYEIIRAKKEDGIFLVAEDILLMRRAGFFRA
jgi:hypothetical protein